MLGIAREYDDAEHRGLPDASLPKIDSIWQMRPVTRLTSCVALDPCPPSDYVRNSELDRKLQVSIGVGFRADDDQSSHTDGGNGSSIIVGSGYSFQRWCERAHTVVILYLTEEHLLNCCVETLDSALSLGIMA